MIERWEVALHCKTFCICFAEVALGHVLCWNKLTQVSAVSGVAPVYSVRGSKIIIWKISYNPAILKGADERWKNTTFA